MNEDVKRILNLIAEGKITSEQADKLINALENKKKKSKKLRLIIEENNKTVLNLKIPLQLAKIGTFFISKSKKAKAEIGGRDFDLSSLDWKEILKNAESGDVGEIFYMETGEDEEDKKTVIRVLLE